MRRFRRSGLSVLLAVTASSSAACGKIVFGSDRVAMDAAPAPDAATVVPEAGTPDTGADPVDAGCMAVPAPAFPASWPFEETRSGYLDNFYGLQADPSAEPRCVACHDNTQPPLIPFLTDVDRPGVLDRAIGELWASAQPVFRAEKGTEVSELLWAHREMGGEPPQYSLDELVWLNRFIDRASACRWVPVYASRPDGGGGCVDGGAPAPEDAGAGADAGVDPDGDVDHDAGDAADDASSLADAARPPDAGGGGGGGAALCECPLRPMDLGYCRP